MKRILLIVSLLFAVVAMYAEQDRSLQKAYIEKYAPLAVEEMYRSGVPASITLAQGLLESRYGQSELAVKGNNHFGIKCHNWNGRKMYKDDDRRGECFRVYESADESFRDHSDFLRYRDRYKFLFDLDPTDYKGWAHGLKKAGYATDPAYPKKLIRLIDEYDLHQYDSKSSSWAKDSKPEKKGRNRDRKRSRKDRKHAEEGRPESPNAIEQARPLDEKQKETFHFALSRHASSLNGVPFVHSAAGESYASIAASNNLFLKEILKYNDLDCEYTIDPGTVVYLQPKKKQAAAGLEKHVVEDPDETLWDISQRYAVRMKNLCRMNDISPDRKLVEGDVIKLRK